MSKRLHRRAMAASVAAVFGAMAGPTGQSIEQAQNRKPTGRSAAPREEQERRMMQAEMKRRRRARKRAIDHSWAEAGYHPVLAVAEFRQLL